ncbi:MAG TPA: SLBB domain-containing protein [Candidatus Binatia bacterium]|nr:SLBB domain-containing protein [Candidatus Binatia bacterium]
MSRTDRVLVATGGAAVLLALAAAWILLAPIEGATSGVDDATGLRFLSPAASATDAPAPTSGGTIVVDVEGAVVEPGIRELAAGSRVADAIAAAGGYAKNADLDATAAAINLAQVLADGEQVVVPRVGAAITTAAASSREPAEANGGGTGGGLVNLNTATPDELEALPGIGAVTVEKIIAARQERPFASLDDAVQRGVIHRGQLEDIQGLATAG